MSKEKSIPEIRALKDEKSVSVLRRMTRVTREEFKRTVRVHRSQLDPPPKVERYYYLPDRWIVLVYDDGYEQAIMDDTRDDEGLRSEGWKPITNEESLAAKEAAEKEALDPYLIYFAKTLEPSLRRARAEQADSSTLERSN